jgi:DnaJ-class molecular chaperone
VKGDSEIFQVAFSFYLPYGTQADLIRMADDYYQVLGLSRNASAEEIHKAHKKLARMYHPDLHEDAEPRDKQRAKEQFQKVQQAYDVLSDPEKRKMYDQLGPDFERMGGAGGNPFQGGGNPFGGAGGADFDFSQLFGGGGMEDILRQMGGAGGMGGNAGGGRNPFGGRSPGGPPPQPQAVEQEITVPFSVAVQGGQHQVSFQRSNGKVENITVKIPQGIESGKKIRLRGQGRSAGPGGQRGDLLIIVKVASHPSFTRSGLNLSVTVPISVLEAANGAKIDLPTPHGTVVLSVPPGTSSGKSLRLKGMGVRKDGGQKGDLIATLQIRLPDEISDDDRALLSKLDDQWKEVVGRSEIVW